MVTPLTNEEKNWIDNQFSYFEPNDSPPGDPNTPLEYTFIDKDMIEEDIEDGIMTPKDLEIFNSIMKKLGKNRIYTINAGSDPQVDQYPDLRDSVIRAGSFNNVPQLTVTWSDLNINGGDVEYFGAFDKNTGQYIKYSDLG